jgi:uncharacterized membrane protein
MNPESYATATGWRPLHPIVTPLAAGLFLAALVTDVAYIKTYNDQWATFSIWLVSGGMVLTALAFVLWLVDISVGRRTVRPAWGPFLAGGAAALLSLLNAFIHSGDGFTSVYPLGVTLSAIVVLLLVFLGLNRWTMTRPARTGA